MKCFSLDRLSSVARFFLLAATLLCTSTASLGQKKKMNVLFVIADDLTSTAISSYGNKESITPNIDKLAAEGIRYTHAYAQFPVCGPSRASFMFGYYPSATKVYGYTSGREAVGPAKLSWAQLFKNNGYYTARVSKIFHMGTQDMMDGKDGTDDPESWTERFNNQDPQWNAEGEGELVQNNPYGKQPPKQGKNLMSIVKAEGEDADYGDGKTADKISQLLREHNNKPFFIAAGFIRPHVPFTAPKKYFTPYPYKEVTMPPKVVGDWDDIPTNGINYVTSLNGLMSEEQEKKAVAGYYAATAYMDAQFGKILKTLEEENLEQNTIVIFTSDHGFHLGEHNFWMKVGLHEESAKTPLIIKVPGKNTCCM
jgi:iduronate 2-sulfatase